MSDPDDQIVRSARDSAAENHALEPNVPELTALEEDSIDNSKKLASLLEHIEKQLITLRGAAEIYNTIAARCSWRQNTLKVASILFASVVPMSAIYSKDFGGEITISSQELGLMIAGVFGVATTAVLSIEAFFGFQRKAEHAESVSNEYHRVYREAKYELHTIILVDDIEERIGLANGILRKIMLQEDRRIHSELDGLRFINRFQEFLTHSPKKEEK